MEEEQEFKSVFSDMERVHYSNKLSEFIPNDILLLSGSNKYKRLTKTQRFLISCDAIVRNLIEQIDNILLSEKDIDLILEKTRTINVEYKNPCGFILGYIVYTKLKTNGKFNDVEKYKKHLKYVTENILETANYMGSNQNSWGVTPPDIIRYTNLWINSS